MQTRSLSGEEVIGAAVVDGAGGIDDGAGTWRATSLRCFTKSHAHVHADAIRASRSKPGTSGAAASRVEVDGVGCTSP